MPLLQYFYLLLLASIVVSLVSSYRYSSGNKFVRLKYGHQQKVYLSLDSSNDISNNIGTQVIGTVDIKLVSFNVLAPCYNKISSVYSSPSASLSVPSLPIIDKQFESNYEESWINRHTDIINQLIESDADIIMLQEFWTSNEKFKSLYYNLLCNRSSTETATPTTTSAASDSSSSDHHINKKKCNKYTMKLLPRTNHWRSREDGLAILIKEGNDIVLQDTKEINFHDCGDRVAQMLLLAIKSPSSSIGNEDLYQQFIVVNTHLLFPHNQYSTNIRLREITKVLGFIESYRQRELCTTICGRADVRLPVIIAGDFNGSPNGKVFNYVASQNYRSIYQNNFVPTSTYLSSVGATTTITATTAASTTSVTSSNKSSRISHRSHLNKNVLVDHVFFSNPSDQIEELLPPLPDWTNLVYRELLNKINDNNNGKVTLKEAFSKFFSNNDSYISIDSFTQSLNKLGFTGEDGNALTQEEISILIDSADTNGDGMIDYKEFYDRFWLASSSYDDSIDDSLIDNVDNTDDSTDSSSLLTDLSTNKRPFFARSSWLSSTTPVAASAAASDKKLEIIKRGKPKSIKEMMVDSNGTDVLSKIEKKVLTNIRPLGNLSVKDVSIHPKELEHGIWPHDYKMSDHGMLSCVFTAQCLDKEDSNMIINPNPVAMKK